MLTQSAAALTCLWATLHALVIGLMLGQSHWVALMCLLCGLWLVAFTVKPKLRSRDGSEVSEQLVVTFVTIAVLMLILLPFIGQLKVPLLALVSLVEFTGVVITINKTPLDQLHEALPVPDSLIFILALCPIGVMFLGCLALAQKASRALSSLKQE